MADEIPYTPAMHRYSDEFLKPLDRDLDRYGCFAKVATDRVPREVMEFWIQQHAETFLGQPLSPDEVIELHEWIHDLRLLRPYYEKEAIICEVQRPFLALLKK